MNEQSALYYAGILACVLYIARSFFLAGLMEASRFAIQEMGIEPSKTWSRKRNFNIAWGTMAAIVLLIVVFFPK